MGQSARNVMQHLRNEVDTATFGWTEYKAAVAPAYSGAYQEHKAALHAAKDSLQMENKMIWSAFATVVGIAAAPWIARLLEPVEKVELLQRVLSKKTLEKLEEKVSGPDTRRPRRPA